VHVKSTGELISFGFSDRSVRSLDSAKRSANANRWVQTKNDFILADLWSQSEFRTQRKSQRSETIQRIDNLNTNTVLSGLLDFC